MKKINFFMLTIISSICFSVVMLTYQILSYVLLKDFDGTSQSLVNEIADKYQVILMLEPILKQAFLASSFLLFGFSVANNILKLTKISKKQKTIAYIFTFAVLAGLVAMLLVMITYTNVLMYQITSLLMILLIVIWISTLLLDFIKTKNNNASLFSRVLIKVLMLTLIIVNSYKVVNDYNVNKSLINSYDYKITQLQTQLEFVDEDSKEVLLQNIQYYDNMKDSLYTTSLYAGKSAFFMYGQFKTNIFDSKEDKLVQMDQYILRIEEMLYTEDIYDIYQINFGLYIGGNTSPIITIALIILGVLTLKFSPLKREEELHSSEITDLLLEKLEENIITEEEYLILLRRVG